MCTEADLYYWAEKTHWAIGTDCEVDRAWICSTGPDMSALSPVGVSQWLIHDGTAWVAARGLSVVPQATHSEAAAAANRGGGPPAGAAAVAADVPEPADGQRALGATVAAASKTGVVKTWCWDKRFGFICPDDGGEDHFFHQSALVGCSEIDVGTRVHYETVYDERRGKRRARSVSAMFKGDAGGDKQHCTAQAKEKASVTAQSSAAAASPPAADAKAFKELKVYEALASIGVRREPHVKSETGGAQRGVSQEVDGTGGQRYLKLCHAPGWVCTLGEKSEELRYLSAYNEVLAWKVRQALANDMMTFYSPEELFAGNVTLLEMICASVCVTSMVCFTLEKRYRNERSFDMEAGNNTRRMAARGNATSFPMPWTDMLAQLTALEEGASKARPPSVPRTGKELADIVSVILKSGGDDDTAASMAKFIHQAVVRRDVVVKLIEGAKKRGHRAYQHVCMEDVRKKAAELPDGEVPPEIMRLVPLDNELDKIQMQKAATPVPRPDGLQEAAEILETAKGNAVVLEKSSFDDGDINAQRVEALRSFVQRVSPECEHDGTSERTDHSESESEHEGARAKRPREGGRETEPDVAPAKEREDARFLTEALERTWFTYVSANPKDLDAQITAEEISEGAKQIYRALAGKYQDVNGKKQKVMGDMAKVRHVPGLGRAAHKLLANIEHASRRLPGTQETRRVMRFQTNALRVRYGVPIFVTFSPDEGHNMIMVRLSRTRRRDPVHNAADDADDAAASRAAGSKEWPQVAPETDDVRAAIPLAAILSRVLRGDPMDWDAIEKEFMPAGMCALCSSVKYKNQYAVGQWSRGDGRRVCQVCLEGKKSSGTPWQCTECFLWKSQDAFHASQHHSSKLTSRRCVDCPERRKCYVCEGRKYEEAFVGLQWDKAARKDIKTCVVCEKAQRQDCFSDWMWNGVADLHRKCKRCVAAPKKDMKTCAVCEKAHRQDWFSDWMWNGVADLHRKCKQCVAAGRKEVRTCVACEKAQQKDCFSEKMWDGRAEQHRKCKRCIDDAKLQRGKWKCVECKGAFGRDEYSSWLAGRTTQKADGKQ
ncbi:unnamed protein product, partial [Prorocentrum cordatum]